MESLVRYCGGELAGRRRQRIAAHVRECAACRLECHRLEHAGGEKAPPAPQPDPAMLAALVADIVRWQAARSQPDRNGDAMRRRVATELAPFLGPEVAERMLQRVAASGEDLLSAIEPMLALFLGNQAASLLVSHVVDGALVKT